MGPRNKRRMHLESLESRWLMSASAGYGEEHQPDVDVANDAPVQMSGQEETARDTGVSSASRKLIELREGKPASLAEGAIGARWREKAHIALH